MCNRVSTTRTVQEEGVSPRFLPITNGSHTPLLNNITHVLQLLLSTLPSFLCPTSSWSISCGSFFSLFFYLLFFGSFFLTNSILPFSLLPSSLPRCVPFASNCSCLSLFKLPPFHKRVLSFNPALAVFFLVSAFL